MKTGFFLVSFLFIVLLSANPAPSIPLKSDKLPPASEEELDQSAVSIKQTFEKTEREPLNEKTEEEETKSQIDQENSSLVITKKIKSVFEDFIKILENRSVESQEYKKAVKFLENSLYNEAGFESLKLLAQVYNDREDFQNQINVLNILAVNYPKNPESFYLLAMGYKNKYLRVENDGFVRSKKEILKEKERFKKEVIRNLNKALELDSKNAPSYLALLDILMILDPNTEEKLHTRASLSVVLDMWKSFKQNKYYIDLCKAYYDNQFFKQSLKACARSVKKNPKDPISPLILSLSLPDKKKKEEKLILTAEAFPDSFFVQYKIGLYFMDKSPRSSILYLTSAHKLDSKHVTLNKILAKLLFDNGEEEKSYDYFLSSCLLTDGVFLEEFRKAQSGLRRKNKVDLVVKFKKGLKECYQKLKQKKD